MTDKGYKIVMTLRWTKYFNSSFLVISLLSCDIVFFKTVVHFYKNNLVLWILQMGAPFGAPQQFVYNPQAGVPLQQAYVPPNAPPVRYCYLHFHFFLGEAIFNWGNFMYALRTLEIMYFPL